MGFSAQVNTCHVEVNPEYEAKRLAEKHLAAHDGAGTQLDVIALFVPKLT